MRDECTNISNFATDQQLPENIPKEVTHFIISTQTMYNIKIKWIITIIT